MFHCRGEEGAGRRAIAQWTTPVKGGPELATVSVPLDAAGLEPGEHVLEVSGAGIVRQSLTFGILPPGSLSTLDFRLQAIERSLTQPRPHAVGTRIAADTTALTRDFESLRRGEDPVSLETGVIRRSFRSGIDGTLQPHSLRPVASPKQGKRCPVDSRRIFLAGFPMGGYGVYRTFYEDPMRYRGLVVLSGLPDPDSSGPDSRDPGNLAAFRGVDVFITHGTEDRNCPFADTQRLVARLREAGAGAALATRGPVCGLWCG